MLIHQHGWQMRYPLGKRDVLVIRTFEHLEKDQILVARILDVMKIRYGNTSGIFDKGEDNLHVMIEEDS